MELWARLPAGVRASIAMLAEATGGQGPAMGDVRADAILSGIDPSDETAKRLAIGRVAELMSRRDAGWCAAFAKGVERRLYGGARSDGKKDSPNLKLTDAAEGE